MAAATRYRGDRRSTACCRSTGWWCQSLRRPTDQFDNSAIPSPISFTNYSDVFKPGNNFARALLNSLIVAGSVTVLTLLIGMFAAYALARLEFRGKNFVLAIIIVTLDVPGHLAGRSRC